MSDDAKYMFANGEFDEKHSRYSVKDRQSLELVLNWDLVMMYGIHVIDEDVSEAIIKLVKRYAELRGTKYAVLHAELERKYDIIDRKADAKAHGTESILVVDGWL
jgi:hypothetical protein